MGNLLNYTLVQTAISTDRSIFIKKIMTESNKRELYRKQRMDAERLFLHGLNEMSPERIIRSAVVLEEDRLTVCGRSYALTPDRRIWVFGSGKAAGRMALELENILGKKVYDGIVICPYGLKTVTRRIQQFEAAHPVPDLNSLTATYELVDVASDVRETDLLLYLMSGGSSSLLCLPDEELEFEDVRELYRLLLQSGAPIGDVNRIRKSISQVKGGKLRHKFGHATVELLAVSDVPGNDPAAIGSGPLVHDPVLPGDALQLLQKYKLNKKIPGSIIRFLEKKQQSQEEHFGEYVDERSEKHSGFHPGKCSDDHSGAHPKKYSGAYPRKHSRMPSEQKTFINVIASVEMVADIIKKEAGSMGYHTWLNDDFLTGEARKVAKDMAARAVDVLSGDKPVHKPAAMIYYGETTVTVKGTGKGGRNQELALSAALALDGQHCITILSAGTDGKDGETNAAGAFCNGQTVPDARKAGIDPESFLDNNDSWNFFRNTDGLLITGVTGNNLMDIQIVLVEK